MYRAARFKSPDVLPTDWFFPPKILIVLAFSVDDSYNGERFGCFPFTLHKETKNEEC